jgi:hypothetical protein
MNKICLRNNYRDVIQILGVSKVKQKTLPILIAVISSAWLIGACGSESLVKLGGFCNEKKKCAAGLTCYQNICLDEVHLDCNPPCGDNQHCVDGVCQDVVLPEDKDGDTFQTPDDCNDCDASIYPGSSESCDGADNDCDNITDEDCPACSEGTKQACSTDMGECILGEQSCINGDWQPCPGIGPSCEICDGKDNDCDGLTDELCPCKDGDQFSCSNGEVGECQGGIQNCVDGLYSETCLNGVLPTTELCDNKDNDCDGETDDDFNIGAVCPQVGECAEGLIECAGTESTVCSTHPGGSLDQSTTEICDQLDNDCDGYTDEEGDVGQDTTPNECMDAAELGSIVENDPKNEIFFEEYIWPGDDVDWYEINAIDDYNQETSSNCDKFHFKVQFVDNPDGRFRIRVSEKNCTSQVCGGDTVFEYYYDYHEDIGSNPSISQGQCPCSVNNIENATICSEDNKTFFIQVYSPDGVGSCNKYRISISNGPQ